MKEFYYQISIFIAVMTTLYLFAIVRIQWLKFKALREFHKSQKLRPRTFGTEHVIRADASVEIIPLDDCNLYVYFKDGYLIVFRLMDDFVNYTYLNKDAERKYFDERDWPIINAANKWEDLPDLSTS